jgi:hypothetical protein
MGIMIQKKSTGMPNENRNEQRKKPSRIDYDPPKKHWNAEWKHVQNY